MKNWNIRTESAIVHNLIYVPKLSVVSTNLCNFLDQFFYGKALHNYREDHYNIGYN